MPVGVLARSASVLVYVLGGVLPGQLLFCRLAGAAWASGWRGGSDGQYFMDMIAVLIEQPLFLASILCREIKSSPQGGFVLNGKCFLPVFLCSNAGLCLRAFGVQVAVTIRIDPGISGHVWGRASVTRLPPGRGLCRWQGCPKFCTYGFLSACGGLTAGRAVAAWSGSFSMIGRFLLLLAGCLLIAHVVSGGPVGRLAVLCVRFRPAGIRAWMLSH